MLSRQWYILDYHMDTLLSYLRGEGRVCLMVVEKREVIDHIGCYVWGIYTQESITVTAV
jgi:hypothetical protein